MEIRTNTLSKYQNASDKKILQTGHHIKSKGWTVLLGHVLGAQDSLEAVGSNTPAYDPGHQRVVKDNPDQSSPVPGPLKANQRVCRK